MKIKEFFENIECLQCLTITLSVMIIIMIIILSKILQIYLPQAKVVIHDYGQIFETEEEWIKWRLDHERR